MKLRTDQQINAFQKAIDECSMPVWLISVEGEEYNMKKTADRYMGIARLLNDDTEELELFASNDSDEMIMMDFYRNYCMC